MRKTMLAAIAVALASCQTAADQKRPLISYPEAKELAYCLRDRAKPAARQEGGPLELGIVVASMCSGPRNRLHDAISRDEGPRYAYLVMRDMERDDAKLAAEAIVRYRAGG